MLGVEPRAIALPAEAVGMTPFARGIVRIAIRIVCNIVFVLIAIICPSFDRIMSFLGSALCFSICVILPLLFYLKIFGDEVSRREKILDWILVIVSSILAIIGTGFTFVSKETLGIKPVE